MFTTCLNISTVDYERRRVIILVLQLLGRRCGGLQIIGNIGMDSTGSNFNNLDGFRRENCVLKSSCKLRWICEQ